MSYMLKLKVVYSYLGFMKGRNRNAPYVGGMNESSFLWFIFPTPSAVTESASKMFYFLFYFFTSLAWEAIF